MYEIVICDDTESDLLQLKMAVEKSEHYDMSSMNIHTFSSGMSYLEDMKVNTDLILIDMQMQLMNGFETITELRKKNQTAVVCFCSAVVTPQTEHFEVSPYRYILKNEGKEKIAKTIDDLLIEMKRRKQQKTLEVVSDGKASLIPVNDILYIEKAKHGCHVVLSPASSLNSEDGKIISREKLAVLEEELNEEGFAVPHSSYLVNIKRITSISNDEIFMEGDIRISVSRSCRENFHHQFSRFFGKKYRRG
ncbi:LytTR family DNA-binding domain-containing protein [Treponema sp.]|uniref:LytR/AlgR family response regulator transcription factor n=1 Tax=Treponema sp. TaxID=166 RepID=UPI00298E4D0B|nr:LytTR family DNA-binding domain-containing protein [Treponema sp.]MCQ2240957.1 LytTR family DNA-binding domain-containing protein [Treponema sp.]